MSFTYAAVHLPLLTMTPRQAPPALGAFGPLPLAPNSRAQRESQVGVRVCDALDQARQGARGMEWVTAECTRSFEQCVRIDEQQERVQ
jgi:hypothetical protein